MEVHAINRETGTKNSEDSKALNDAKPKEIDTYYDDIEADSSTRLNQMNDTVYHMTGRHWLELRRMDDPLFYFWRTLAGAPCP